MSKLRHAGFTSYSPTSYYQPRASKPTRDRRFSNSSTAFLAVSTIDGVFSSAIGQINPIEAVVISTSHAPVVITETDANTFIAMNTAAPIQQMHMTITQAGLRLDFQLYGFTSTVTGVPQAVNGQLVMTNVTVQGIASLIMSPDELTTIVNANLHQISTVLHRSISGVILKDHEMDVQLR